MKWQLDSLEFEYYDWSRRDAMPERGADVFILESEAWKQPHMIEANDITAMNLALKSGAVVIGSGVIVQAFNDGEDGRMSQTHVVAWRRYLSDATD